MNKKRLIKKILATLGILAALSSFFTGAVPLLMLGSFVGAIILVAVPHYFSDSEETSATRKPDEYQALMQKMKARRKKAMLEAKMKELEDMEQQNAKEGMQ